MDTIIKVGEIYKTTCSGKVKVIEKHSAINLTLIFEDGTIIKNVYSDNLIKGNVRNPNLRNENGGFIGVGKHKSKKKNNRSTKAYNCWSNMLYRCYDKKHHLKYPTYKDCTVCDDWLNFQNFAEWYEQNFVEGWQLDKDIILNGNRIYCKDTCCFVPREINILFKKHPKTSLPLGIAKHHKKFRVRFNRHSIRYHIGIYDTIEEAFKIYNKERKDYLKELIIIFDDKLNPKIKEILWNK